MIQDNCFKINQQNYKEIAKIFDKHKFDKSGLEREHIAEELADYFEKEQNKPDEDGNVTSPDSVYRFNKKQFLEDCGITEVSK